MLDILLEDVLIIKMHAKVVLENHYEVFGSEVEIYTAFIGTALNQSLA